MISSQRFLDPRLRGRAGRGGAGPKWVNSICVELRRQYPCPLALKCTPYIDGGRSGLFITWSSKWFLNSYCLITYPPINHCIAWPSNLYSLLASLIYIYWWNCMLINHDLYILPNKGSPNILDSTHRQWKACMHVHQNILFNWY